MTIRLWDVNKGELLRVLEGHTNRVSSVAFSPDGTTLASGSFDNTIRLWDVATGNQISPLRGHTGPVLSVAFSPDGKTLVSGSEDRTVRIWDATGDWMKLTDELEVKKKHGASRSLFTVPFVDGIFAEPTGVSTARITELPAPGGVQEQSHEG